MESLLLDVEVIKFKLKGTPGKRGSGELSKEVSQLESQSSVADRLPWKEDRSLVF